MSATLPSLFVLANGRYSVTVRYDGINKTDPIRNMARCENLPRGGLRGVRGVEQPPIGNDLPDVPTEESARIPFASRGARDLRVEVKLVCNLEQTHERDYVSSQNLWSDGWSRAHLIDRNDLRPG